MSDYTPSLEEAREQYWAASGDPRRDSGAWGEFDRMIETVRAEEREKAAQIAEGHTLALNIRGEVWVANTIAARIRNQEAGE